MSISCKVIKDLLPLYADGACSDETKKLVEKHIGDCEDCFEALRKMQSPIETEKSEAIKKRYSAKKAFKKIRRIWVVSVIIVLVIAIPLAYLGVNQAANNGGVSFSNLGIVMKANEIASAFRSNDAGRIAGAMEGVFEDKYNTAVENIYEEAGGYSSEYSDTKGNTVTVGAEFSLSNYSEITVDGVRFYATQDVLEGEYAAYLKDGNAAKFWLSIINNHKSAVPDKALSLVKDGYRSLIDEKSLNALTYGWYNGETYYYKQAAETGVFSGANFGFRQAQVVPEQYYTDRVEEMEGLDQRMEEHRDSLVGLGQETFVEQCKKSMHENMEVMAKRGYCIDGVVFKSCTERNGVYVLEYDLNFTGPKGEKINGVTLLMRYKDGAITEVIETFPEKMPSEYYDLLNVLKTKITTVSY